MSSSKPHSLSGPLVQIIECVSLVSRPVLFFSTPLTRQCTSDTVAGFRKHPQGEALGADVLDCFLEAAVV